MRRTSILIDEATYERFAARARRKGTTVSTEMRQALDSEAASEPLPGQWLLDLADQFSDVEWKAGPAIDSDGFKDDMAREIYRDSFNREPDW